MFDGAKPSTATAGLGFDGSHNDVSQEEYNERASKLES
jgi:hypothetical protein